MNELNNEQVKIDVDAVSKELRIRPEVYLRIVISFVSTLTEKMKLLESAVDQNDYEQIRVILHEIKGTAGNLRLTNISEKEDVMHRAIKEGVKDKDKLLQYYDDLNNESEKLCKYIARITQQSI